MSDFRFSIAGQPAHPHIKLTREAFPRALATRILKNDGDEYFGAFLNRTSVRILIDFLNRVFRLRTCTIPIDGSFPIPCTQYYAKRCVAPCVASLCTRERYLDIVDLVRLFLRNDREVFRAAVSTQIERAAASLDFEHAAFLRDILQSVENYWANRRWQVWLDDSVDTYELEEKDGEISVIVLTQRRNRAVGEIVYTFPEVPEVDSTQALHDVIAQFYHFHLPREIRVSHDFNGRTKLARELVKRFGRKVSIVVTNPRAPRVTAERALAKTKDRLELKAMAPTKSAEEIADEMKQMFGLAKPPLHLEAFDVAHISATGFAAAVSVWSDGEIRTDQYEHWLSDRTSELDTLRAFLARRLGDRSRPDLIVIDGGRSHLNAALDVLADLDIDQPAIVAAVKPRGKHSAISHFLTAGNQRVEFDQDSEACRLLQRLRDDAHELANATHRLRRDMMHFYELAAILPSLNERERHELLREFGSIKKITKLDAETLENRFGKSKAALVSADLAQFRKGESATPRPLIVPIRYVEPDGAADDLRPIVTR